MFPFRTVPSQGNMSHAVHRLIPVSHAQAIQLTCWLPTCQESELARSLVDLELMLLHCHCLLNFAGTPCCCRSSDLSDRRSTASDFLYHQSINLGLLIDLNRLYNYQIDWNSTPFGFLGLLWRAVRASYCLHSLSHHLSPALPPVFLLNGMGMCFRSNGTGWDGNVTIFMPPTVYATTLDILNAGVTWSIHQFLSCHSSFPR